MKTYKVYHEEGEWAVESSGPDSAVEAAAMERWSSESDTDPQDTVDLFWCEGQVYRASGAIEVYFKALKESNPDPKDLASLMETVEYYAEEPT